jgi:GNAT superfamily N-acetyltransferase
MGAFIKDHHGERSPTIQRITGSPRHFVTRDDGLEFAGYVTLKWQSLYSSFRDQNIPEIMDLNVLPPFCRCGIGSMLLETAEKEAVIRSNIVGIGTGLYAGKDGGYGAAQRLYAKSGYIPDGKGVTYNYQPIIPGNSYPLDDDLVLWFTKKLKVKK